MTTSRRTRWSPWIAAPLSVVLVAGACTSTIAGHPRTQHGPAAQVHYGRDPETGAGIRYQPDVVIVDGGASAVKSVTADGLTWVVSGRSRNVGQLQPGKIMYVTAFGVGRVLAVTRVAADRAITIGPVDITDVVRDGEFSSNRPVDLAGALAYSTPNRPGTLSQLPGAADPSASSSPPGASASPGPAGPSTPAASAPASTPSPSDGHSLVDLPPIRLGAPTVPPNPTLPPGIPSSVPSSLPALPPAFGTFPVPTKGSVDANVGSYAIQPFCCSGGIGLHYFYDANGLKVSATLTLKVSAPRVSFDMKIAGGKVITALATLQGASGASMDVKAATTAGRDGNEYRRRVDVPVNFTIPINGLLSITVSQVFSLSTVFSAKDGGISAHAEYSFGGSIGFGYANGSFGLHQPQAWSVVDSLVDSVQGVSVGVTGMVLGYSAKVIVGLGFAGFSAGVWFALSIAYSFTNGSSIGIIVCRGANLDVVLSYGIGYRIPAPVAALISFFLRIFRAPPIQASGGISSQTTLLHRHDYTPKKQICESA